MSLWVLDDDAVRDAETGEVVARTDWGNPLERGGWGEAVDGVTVGWSGWFGADADEDDATRAIRARLRSWTAGAEEFRRVCDGAEGRLVASGGVMCLRPRVGHVLSDVPTCARFLRERAAGPWRLFLDPCGMLTREMVSDAEDHVRRVMEALSEQAWSVLVTNVEEDGEGGLRQMPVHRGLIDVGVLREMVGRVRGRAVLMRGELEEQREVVGV